jgi:ElaB/YqjD/DUF883 family membrane-anchored ribosome-binding protein
LDKAGQLDQLIDDAEELLTNLADAHDPEIQVLRDRVDRAINDAWRSIAQQDDPASAELGDIARSVDDYVRGSPWLAVAAGVLIAGTVAFFAGASLGSKRRP